MKTGRNDPCPCGSGQKYKKCCEAKDEAARTQQLADENAARAAEPEPAADPDAEAAPPPKKGETKAFRGGPPQRSNPSDSGKRPSHARKRSV